MRRGQSLPRRLVSPDGPLFRGGLYAPLIVGGRPVNLAEAAEAFAEPTVFGPGEADDQLFRFIEMLAYPLAPRHLGYLDRGPLCVRSPRSHASFNGWARPRLVKSTQSERELEAVGALARAVVVVDDVVYMECPEPVWSVILVGRRRYRLMLETAPWAASALHHFRLDRHREARAWAAGARRRLARSDVEPPIEILLPGAVRREDDIEIAREAARSWPRAPGGFASCERIGDEPDIHPMLAALASDRPTVDRADAERVMNALERVLGNSKLACWTRHHERLSIRWNAENPTPDLFSVESDSTDELSSEDLAALSDLQT